jgi:hypothetical protein
VDAGKSSIDSANSVWSVDPLLEMVNSIDSMNSFGAPLHPFMFPEHGWLSNRQIDYMVAHFKATIKSFVLDNQTPFIHQVLYEETVPSIYQDALGVCSLVRISHHFLLFCPQFGFMLFLYALEINSLSSNHQLRLVLPFALSSNR